VKLYRRFGAVAVINAAYFMSERITRSRLACDPPDITLAPRIEQIGFMDFHSAAEAIEIGHHCVQQHEREFTLLMKN
jgi:NTE family protein